MCKASGVHAQLNFWIERGRGRERSKHKREAREGLWIWRWLPRWQRRSQPRHLLARHGVLEHAAAAVAALSGPGVMYMLCTCACRDTCRGQAHGHRVYKTAGRGSSRMCPTHMADVLFILFRRWMRK